jgi:hypothetical protein
VSLPQDSDDPYSDVRPDRRPVRRELRPPRSKSACGLYLAIGIPLGVGLFVGIVIVLIVLLTRKPPANDTPAGAPAAVEQPAPVVPPGWKEFRSGPGRYVVVMPATSTERTKSFGSSAGPVTDHGLLYEQEGEFINYGVRYADFSADQLRRMPLSEVMIAGRDTIQKTLGATVAHDRNITSGGRQGREIVMAVPGKGQIMLRYFPMGPRLYSVLAGGLKASSDAPDVRAFFESFRITN